MLKMRTNFLKASFIAGLAIISLLQQIWACELPPVKDSNGNDTALYQRIKYTVKNYRTGYLHADKNNNGPDSVRLNMEPNQRQCWLFTAHSDNKYLLKNMSNGEPYKYLDGNNGRSAIASVNRDTPEVQWKVIQEYYNDRRVYVLINDGMVLDQDHNGVRINPIESNKSNQRWMFIPYIDYNSEGPVRFFSVEDNGEERLITDEKININLRTSLEEERKIRSRL